MSVIQQKKANNPLNTEIFSPFPTKAGRTPSYTKPKASHNDVSQAKHNHAKAQPETEQLYATLNKANHPTVPEAEKLTHVSNDVSPTPQIQSTTNNIHNFERAIEQTPSNNAANPSITKSNVKPFDPTMVQCGFQAGTTWDMPNGRTETSKDWFEISIPEQQTLYRKVITIVNKTQNESTRLEIKKSGSFTTVIHKELIKDGDEVVFVSEDIYGNTTTSSSVYYDDYTGNFSNRP